MNRSQPRKQRATANGQGDGGGGEGAVNLARAVAIACPYTERTNEECHVETNDHHHRSTGCGIHRAGCVRVRAKGPGQRGILSPHPLKDRECLAGCRTDASGRLAGARRAAASCLSGCEALLQTARRTCAIDPASRACKAARSAAGACQDPCYETLRPAVNACIVAGHQCVRACPFIGEPPCNSACRVDHIACQVAARRALIECREGCSDEIAAARTACGS